MYLQHFGLRHPPLGKTLTISPTSAFGLSRCACQTALFKKIPKKSGRNYQEKKPEPVKPKS